MKIAIIGGTGLLGSNLVKLYSKYDVRAFSRGSLDNVYSGKNHIINFDDLSDELSSYFDIWKPDIIINAIAIVSLQQCEENYDMAINVNCNMAVDLAKISIKYNSYFVHISTDHYYDDDLVIHNELQKVVLKNNYARTKYKAEKEVEKYNNKAIIVRTNIVGFRRKASESFFEWVLRSLKNDKTINLYTNFYTSPISVNQLGKILIKCYKKTLSGIYNIASSTVIDKYGFGIKVANKFGYSTKNINATEIKRGSGNNLQRAFTLGLDVSKIENSLQEKMPTIDETLDTLYCEYMDEA
jgi:dTDP-4-dehydrorhamnose reductase